MRRQCDRVAKDQDVHHDSKSCGKGCGKGREGFAAIKCTMIKLSKLVSHKQEFTTMAHLSNRTKEIPHQHRSQHLTNTVCIPEHTVTSQYTECNVATHCKQYCSTLSAALQHNAAQHRWVWCTGRPAWCLEEASAARSAPPPPRQHPGPFGRPPGTSPQPQHASLPRPPEQFGPAAAAPPSGAALPATCLPQSTPSVSTTQC